MSGGQFGAMIAFCLLVLAGCVYIVVKGDDE